MVRREHKEGHVLFIDWVLVAELSALLGLFYLTGRIDGIAKQSREEAARRHKRAAVARAEAHKARQAHQA